MSQRITVIVAFALFPLLAICAAATGKICAPEVGGLVFCCEGAAVDSSGYVRATINVRNNSSKPITVTDYDRIPSSISYCFSGATNATIKKRTSARCKASIRKEWFVVLQPGTSITFTISIRCPLKKGQNELLIDLPIIGPDCWANEERVKSDICEHEWRPNAKSFPTIGPIVVDSPGEKTEVPG
jgi:hypothetical protein